MNKDQYRDLFERTMPYIKYSKICAECGVNFTSFSHFMRQDSKYAISEEKLEIVRQYTIDVLKHEFGLKK